MVPCGCILSKFYIKPQPVGPGKTVKLCCILSKFYIKPQRTGRDILKILSCILSKFYIKPQRKMHRMSPKKSCILSKFYIKPQQRIRHKIGHSVVSYRNSTSNHNRTAIYSHTHTVVSYRNSTSNHNKPRPSSRVSSLYLIEILHQTTTSPRARACSLCCILSKFYIKPQQRIRHKIGHSVVSYRNSTSNHNKVVTRPLGGKVVSYRNSTSNHNDVAKSSLALRLYLIEILHQTTTSRFRRIP